MLSFLSLALGSIFGDQSASLGKDIQNGRVILSSLGNLPKIGKESYSMELRLETERNVRRLSGTLCVSPFRGRPYLCQTWSIHSFSTASPRMPDCSIPKTLPGYGTRRVLERRTSFLYQHVGERSRNLLEPIWNKRYRMNALASK